MKILNGGQLVVERLKQHGVRQIFSIVGGQMGTIYDAVGLSTGIDIFVPRNETVVPLMAAGYTASSGVPSVSMTTVGAGVVYEVAGLLKAWMDYLPVISIAPQVQSYKMKPHQENLQACNQDELFYPITKWNTIVYHWDRIPAMIDRGFREALSGIPGPVHIDIPVDILFKHKILSQGKSERILPLPRKTRYAGGVAGDAGQLRGAAEALCRAERPLLILGQGFGRPGRYEGIRGVLDQLGMPVLETMTGSGVLNGRDGCYAGNLALFEGSGQGMEALKQADLLLIAGIDRYSRELLTRLSEAGVDRPLVQVELEPGSLLGSRADFHPVYADPLAALSHFSRALKETPRDFSGWRETVMTTGDRIAADGSRELGAMGAAVEALAASSTDEHIIVADGKTSSAAALCLLRKSNYRNLFVMDERDFAGAGLAFAIGAAVANPRRRVVLICDKEALFRHLREIQPIASMGMEMVIICHDDADREKNVVDLAAVLEALGCRTDLFDREGTTGSELLKPERGRPRAWMVRG